MSIELLSFVFIGLLWVAVPIAVWLDVRHERHGHPHATAPPGAAAVVDVDDDRLS